MNIRNRTLAHDLGYTDGDLDLLEDDSDFDAGLFTDHLPVTGFAGDPEAMNFLVSVKWRGRKSLTHNI